MRILCLVTFLILFRNLKLISRKGSDKEEEGSNQAESGKNGVAWQVGVVVVEHKSHQSRSQVA